MTPQRQAVIAAAILFAQWTFWDYGPRQVTRTIYVTLWNAAPKPADSPKRPAPDRFMEPSEQILRDMQAKKDGRAI